VLRAEGQYRMNAQSIEAEGLAEYVPLSLSWEISDFQTLK